MKTTRQDGFSLAELMIAMLVTMLVSGGVFMLMTAGQGAFRREPELTDRQQNIRVAMALIEKDLAGAGAGMGTFVQALTRSDAVDEDTGPFLNARGAAGPSGQASDFLQILGNDGECPDVPMFQNNGVNLVTLIGIPPCYGEDQFVMFVMDDGSTRWGFAHSIHSDDNKQVNFPSGQQPPKSQVPGPPNFPPFPELPARMMRVQLVRYEIAADADGVPGLWRSDLGGINPTNGVYTAAPAAAAGWQLVARGIEDLQVRYRQAGAPAYADSPLKSLPANYGTIVQEVEVTLWARTIAANLQGMRNDGGIPDGRVRGSLTSVTPPRASRVALRDPAAGLFQWQ
jgi:type IV pilus assembly protein PilW